MNQTPKQEVKRKIVTLCGSPEFKTEFKDIFRSLTLMDNVVLIAPILDQPSPGDRLDWCDDGTITMLSRLSKYKVNMSDSVYVINKNHIVDDDTKDLINYAVAKGKPIQYYCN